MSAPNHSRLRDLYERLGALVCASALFTAVAAVLHQQSRLPAAYTWMQPFEMLEVIARTPGFPTAALLTWIAGVTARRGVSPTRDLAAVRAAVTRAIAMQYALGAVVVLGADALWLGTRRHPLDLVSLAAMGAFASQYRASRSALGRQVSYVAVGALIFTGTCYAYTILKALTFSTGRSYDAAIIAIEAALLGEAPHRWIAAWAAQHPSVIELCDWVYFRVFQHMALTTVLLVAMHKLRERTEYLGALAICYLLGGPLYHVWPAAGPSYFEPELFPYLHNQDYLASRVRVWLAGNTDSALNGSALRLETWSYIACMPSLHAAHEFVMLYYARFSRPAFAVSLVFTSITMLGIVVLGWHYPIDAVAGGVLAIASIAIARRWRGHLMPRGLVPIDDGPA